MAEWKNLCRGCLGTGPQVSFFDGDDEIRQKFQESTSIEVLDNDDLPTNLCLDCLDVLNTSHEFRKQCLRNDAEIRDKLREETEASKRHRVDITDMFEHSLLTEMPLSVKMEEEENGAKEENGDSNLSDEDICYVLIVDDDKNIQVLDAEKHRELLNQGVKLERIEEDFDAEQMLVDSALNHEAEEVLNEEQPDNLDPDDIEQQILAFDEDNSHISIQEDDENITTVTPDISALIRSAADGQLEMDPSEANKLIQIISSGGIEGIANEDGTVTYITTQQTSEDGVQEEIVVCEADEQYGLFNYDGSELVIEYMDANPTQSMRQEDGTYICGCGLQLPNIADFEKHQWTHGVYSCPICGKCYESEEIVSGHVLLHRTSDQLIRCPICEQMIKRNYITQHIKVTHNEIKPKCTLCSKTFANDNNLKRHMLIHRGVKEFACDICHKRFNQKITMQTHRLTHETVDVQTCNICRKFFDSKEALHAHLASHDSEDSKAAENIADIHYGKLLVKFACPECPKEYGSAMALNYHMENTHATDRGELLCYECGEVLPNRKAMFAHTYTHKQPKLKNARRFICGTCSKQCASHAMLVMHERVHTNERPFPCEHCPLRFKTKTHLRTHQLTHTREKKFCCSVCMKYFALKGNLVVHLRTHTGEKPYACSLCGDAFIDSKYLKKHKMKKHAIVNLPWNRYS